MSLNGYSWVEGNVPNYADASGLQSGSSTNLFGEITEGGGGGAVTIPPQFIADAAAVIIGGTVATKGVLNPPVGQSDIDPKRLAEICNMGVCGASLLAMLLWQLAGAIPIVRDITRDDDCNMEGGTLSGFITNKISKNHGKYVGPIKPLSILKLGRCRPMAIVKLVAIRSNQANSRGDNKIFANSTGDLPGPSDSARTGSDIGFREYRVSDPFVASGPSLHRIITFGQPRRAPNSYWFAYYSDDHYDTFNYIVSPF
jgi:hypothetical protein